MRIRQKREGCSAGQNLPWREKIFIIQVRDIRAAVMDFPPFAAIPVSLTPSGPLGIKFKKRTANAFEACKPNP